MRYKNDSKFDYYFTAIGNLLYYGALVGGLIVLIVWGILKLFGWDGDKKEPDIYFYLSLLAAWGIGVLFIAILTLIKSKKHSDEDNK